LALKDPLAWAEQVQNPAIRAKGINPDDNMEMAKVLGTMYRNQMANQFANDISQLNSRNRLHKDEDLLNKTMTVDQAFDYNMKNDPTQAIKTVSGAITDLSQALTAPSLASAGPVLTSIAAGVKQLSQALQDHPNIATAAGVTGGAAALGGSGYLAASMAGGLGMTAVSGLATAVGALGTAAAVATGSVSGLYLLMQKFDPLGAEERKKRDDEILAREGRQPGGKFEHEINPFKTGGLKPWVTDLFGGGAPVGTDGTGPQMPGYQPYGSYDLRAAAAPPGWTVNAPQKAFPMTGAGGATAGAEGPEFPNVSGLGGASGVADALNNGAQTQAAGAASGAGYMEGLRSQLDAAASYAEEVAERIRRALDFSVTPQINSPSSSEVPPRRTSSLSSPDARRASAAETSRLV
jgi:hypothetical protein